METKLPEGWELKTIESVCKQKPQSGGTPLSSKSEYYDGDIPWVITADMTDAGMYINKTRKKITKMGLESSSARMFPVGTILFSMYGSIGKSCITEIELCTNQAILGIIPNNSIVTTKYLYYCLQNLTSEFLQMGRGGTQDNINAKMVKEYSIPVPPLPVQKEIVIKLDAFFKEYNELKVEKEKVKKNHEKIIQSAIAKLLESLKTKEQPLSELFEVRKEKKDPLRSEVKNYVGLEHIESNTRKILGFQKVPEIKSMKNSFYKGDILYGKLRPYLNKVCVAPFDGVCSTDIIALQSHEDVDTEFLLYLLNSYNIVEQLSHLSYGMRMPRVSEKHFEQITVKVPSFSDQKKVVEKLKTIDNIYSDIEKINKNILSDVQNLPHSVLKKAFNGELIS